MEFSYGYFIWYSIYSLYSFLEFQFLFQGYLFEDIFIFSWGQPFLIEIEIGFPLLLGDWDFFLKLGLKDNLGFVGLIGEGGCYWLWIIMDWLFFGFQRFLWGYLLLYGFSSLSGSLGFPLLWALKVVALGRGQGGFILTKLCKKIGDKICPPLLT